MPKGDLSNGSIMPKGDLRGNGSIMPKGDLRGNG